MKRIDFLLYGLIMTCTLQPTRAQSTQTGANIAVTNTESGKVRGYIHNGIFTYKGIPYAQAERFMPPAKAKAVAE